MLPYIIAGSGQNVPSWAHCVICALQDVAPEDAGKLLGITNMCGTVVGIIGNIMTGNIAASRLGYSAVFALISGGYLSSFAVWRIWVNGQNIVVGKQQK